VNDAFSFLIRCRIWKGSTIPRSRDSAEDPGFPVDWTVSDLDLNHRDTEDTERNPILQLQRDDLLTSVSLWFN
jgi:hypothetical protein